MNTRCRSAKFRTVLSLALMAFAIPPSAARAQSGATPELRVTTSAADVRLDGVLDEPAWSSSSAISALTMVEPQEGGSPSYPTRIVVIATARMLLIGIECIDAEPDAIVAISRDRDADLSSEDHVRLMFDTFLSGRTGYVFSVGPGGARYDALINDGGDTERREWDTSWEAATARSPRGWSVEIRIPVQSLAFRDGLGTWGFNVERRVQRLLEVNRWASPLRAARLIQPARAGRLVGLPAFIYGAGLTVRPAVVSGMRQVGPAAPRDGVADVSLDASQRLGANALASVTINTDFAETEVDARRANLTRFPLFFPEKRTFFLEGSDIFDFGVTLEHETDVLPFFTRRIGLFRGQEVPLLAGARIGGRVGRASFGALTVRAGQRDTVVPATTLLAARIRQNVLQESSIGLIATTGDPEGRPGARLLGADATFRTSRLFGDRNLVVAAWGLRSDRDSLRGDRDAWGFAAAYPNNMLAAQVLYKRLGTGFDPSLGFVPRRGVEIVSGGVDRRVLRPVGGVRDAVVQLHGRVVLDSLRRWESYFAFAAPFYLRFESGDRVEFNVAPYGERLAQPFDIAPNVTIPAGQYEWIRYRLEGTFATKRAVSGRVTWWFGDFYDGRLDELAATLVIRPSAAASLELTAVRNAGSLPVGEFTQEVFRARARLNLSADLTFNSLVQYDNQSRTLGANSRLRWQFHPLGELFLVHTHNVDRSGGRFAFASSQLLAKVQYAIRR